MRVLLTFIFLLVAQLASAQTFGQGAPATTSDATAWPIKVVFGGVQIDPRAVTVQNPSLVVTGTFWQATQPVSIAATVTVDTELAIAAALTDNFANPTTAPVGAFNMVWDGSTWDRWTGAVSVSNTVTITDGSGALTVDGTVTVTDGAGALNVIVDSGAITATVSDGSGALTVDGTVAVSGTVTTAPTYADATGTTVPSTAAFVAGTDGTNTRALKTDSGGELQVDVLSMPTTTITDGSGALNVIVDSGSITATVSDGAGALNTIVDSGTLTSITNAVTVTDGSGALNVIVDSSALPSGAATSANQTNGTQLSRVTDGTDTALVSGSGSLQVTCDNCGGASPFEDNDAFTAGTSSVAVIGAVVDDTTTTSVSEDSAGAPRITPNRALHNVIRDAAGNERGANVTASNALVVDGSAVTQPISGTVTANVQGSTTLGDSMANPTTALSTAAFNVLYDPGTTNWKREIVASWFDASNTGANFGVTALAGMFDNSSPYSVSEGAYGALRVSSNRSVYTQIRDGASNQERGAAVTAANALVVDGSGVTQPVSGTVTVGTFPDNEPINVAQMNGVAVSMGNGASGTGVQRVTIANDSTGQVAVASLPNEGQQTAANSISVTPDTDNDAVGATGAAPPGEVVDIGGRTSGADTTGLMTGVTVCTEHVVVNVSSATTTLIITGVANRHVRICALNLVTAAANDVAFIAGTGATCGTSSAGMNGGTTAASGWNLGANGGLTIGSGVGEVMSTKVSGGATGDSVCVVTSAATQLSGTISYAIY